MLVDAAIIADRWHMDVVAVLDEADEFRALVRVAGHLALNRLQKAASERQNRK